MTTTIQQADALDAQALEALTHRVEEAQGLACLLYADLDHGQVTGPEHAWAARLLWKHLNALTCDLQARQVGA